MQQKNQIQVREYGTYGPYVVLLHGGPGAPGEMAPVANFLSKKYRILEPLQRKSNKKRLTVAQHVSDLHAVLQLPLQEGPVSLVGYSWGAMLALTYASRNPLQVERLILIGCGTFNEASRLLFHTNLEQQMNPDERDRLHALETKLASEKDPHRRNELFKKFGIIQNRIQAFRPILSEPEETLFFDEKGFRETWEDAISLQEQNIQPAEFKNIRIPVFMIHGNQDPHPGQKIFESLKPYIQKIQFMEISRCGHKPWIEQESKDVFYELLIKYLKEER